MSKQGKAGKPFEQSRITYKKPREVKTRDQLIHDEVFKMLDDCQQKDPKMILGQCKCRRSAVVSSTGGENSSPVAVSGDRLVGAVLGCPNGEGFGIVSSPRRLRK
jgi:hypothetical protein